MFRIYLVVGFFVLSNAYFAFAAQTPNGSLTGVGQKSPSSPAPTVCVVGTIRDVYMSVQQDGSRLVKVNLEDPEKTVYIDLREARRIGLVISASGTNRSVDFAVTPHWRLSFDCPPNGRPYSVLKVDKNLPPRVEASDLIDAVAEGDVADVQTLLAKGADVNTRTRGETVLMVAAQKGYTDIVQALLAKGANVNAKMADGATALMLAAESGHTEVLQALLSKGADANAKPNNGFTALILAALNGHTEIVQALLAKGADVNAKMADGGTALNLAERKGYTAIVQLLKNGNNP